MLSPVTQRDMHLTSTPSRRWRIANVATIGSGLLGTFVVMLLWGFQSHGKIDPRSLRQGDATPLDAAWIIALLLSLTALVAVAGLPRSRDAEDAWGSGAGQIAGSVAAGLGTLTGTLLGNIWIYGPQDRCVHASCWPAHFQAAAAAAPGAVTAIALLTAGLLARRVAWPTRALLPALVWVAAVLLLRALWGPLLVPVFQGSPP
jgi:hypothetical protein